MFKLKRPMVSMEDYSYLCMSDPSSRRCALRTCILLITYSVDGLREMGDRRSTRQVRHRAHLFLFSAPKYTCKF